MQLGFYIILAAQFFSALADNALLFAAIALLAEIHAPDWQTPVLHMYFVFSYIVLAPFVGPFADALPKGKVMFISNGVKLAGCLAMLAGLHPLYAYGVVGIGAAMYSPAKYGILTEYLPSSKLVLANGWMEGLTVAAIILGAVAGGYMASPGFSSALGFAPGTPLLDSAPKIAVAFIVLLYVAAALINIYIPRVALDHKLPRKTLPYILRDYWTCFWQLWRDPLGQVSLAVTMIFWGTGATLRLIVLNWSETILGMDPTQATQITALVAVGIAVGAAVAAKTVQLERAVKILPMGIAVGITVMLMVFARQWWLLAIGLLIIGGLGGFFVVPMNALLQHRGHLLMGAGHSIAVQNFNEHLSILAMQGMYAGMLKLDMPLEVIVVFFGLMLAVVMHYLWRRHGGTAVGVRVSDP
ncbi:MAG: lysophospholipid transporter LplT [Burkholderiales bacterium]